MLPYLSGVIQIDSSRLQNLWLTVYNIKYVKEYYSLSYKKNVKKESLFFFTIMHNLQWPGFNDCQIKEVPHVFVKYSCTLFSAIFVRLLDLIKSRQKSW